MPNENWVFWLDVTNLVLGIVVILAAAAAGYGLVWEFVLRHKKAHRAAANVDVALQKLMQDEFSDSLPAPELGFTMADGGERFNPPPQKPEEKNQKQEVRGECAMSCPFLKEGHAQSCHAAPLHKLIFEGPGVSGAGRCTSEHYHLCEQVKNKDAGRDRCPHLEDIHVQYCGANTPTIPFSESQLSICMTGANPHKRLVIPASMATCVTSSPLIV